MQLSFGLPNKWETGKGLYVRPYRYQGPRFGTTVITAIHVDGGFQQHTSGVFVRAAMVDDVFATWGFGWEEVILNWPDLNRTIFWGVTLQNALTAGDIKRVIVRDDSHNEDLPGETADGWTTCVSTA